MKRIIIILTLAALTVSLAACGESGAPTAVFPSGAAVAEPSAAPSAGADALRLDTRATAAQTFGGALDAVNTAITEDEATDDGEIFTSAPGDEYLTLSELMSEFLEYKRVFTYHLGSACTQAGVQQTPESEIIRFDPIELIELFGALQGYDGGSEGIADAMGGILSGGFSCELEKGDGGSFKALLYDSMEDGRLTRAFAGNWYPEEQYLFCVYMTEYDEDYMEIDIQRRDFGYASGYVCQYYDPSAPAIYRFAFTTDGSWDGSIGCTFEISDQPSVLNGDETLGYGFTWPELGQDDEIPEHDWGWGWAGMAINGASLMVNAGNGDAPQEWDIDLTEYGDPGEDGPNVTPGADAASYARVWHGSPVLAAGWSERFALHEDGTFLWGANEMDGASRLRYLTGTWEVRDGQLTLHATLAVNWDGGELVPNDGFASYGSDEVLKDYTVGVYAIDNELTLPIGEITFDGERGLDSVTINELQCWDCTAQSSDAFNGFWKILTSALTRAPAAKSKTVPEVGL